MLINERYEKLTIREKDSFTKILNKLLRVNYIVRDVYSSKDKEMKLNYEYTFLERNIHLYENYLAIGGWQIHKDDRFGVIYIVSSYNYNKHRLKKFSTIVLLILRLIYDEEREKLSLKREVTITVHNLVQKMISLGIVNKKPSIKEISETLSEISGFQIIQKMDGGFGDSDTRFMIYPSILFILTNAKINALNQLIDDSRSIDDEYIQEEVTDGSVENEGIQ